MTPYPYQQVYLDDIRKGWREFRRQVVVSPTGSGKTRMFCWMAEEAADNGLRTLILVDQDELVAQTLEKLQDTGYPASLEKAEHRAARDCPIVVSTIQTMSGRFEEWPANHFGLVVADEADKSVSPMWQRTLKYFDPHARVCGFTATPHRTDKKNLGCYYERLVEHENLFSLADKGYLAPVTVAMLPVKIDLSQATVKRGDYVEEELDEILGPHLAEIAGHLKTVAAFRKTIVFLPLIKTAERFASICRDLGLAAESIHGKSEDRREKLERFRNWDFDVLANSALLTRGYDDPAIDCCVPCRPTKSVTLYFQMVGRATRIAPGKRDALVVDFLWQSARHLVCRPAHLIAQSDDEVEQITEMLEKTGLPADVADQMPLDLQDVSSEARAKREAALRKKLDQQRNKKAKTVSAEQFALEHGSLETAEYQETMPWESQPASDKQLKMLKWARIDLATVRGKGHASKLISLHFQKRPLQLASDKQRALMRRLGHPSSDNATADEARRFFADLRRPRQEALL